MIVAHGLTSAEQYALLAGLLLVVSWGCSILAGLVAIFVCSCKTTKGRRWRRALAVINLVFTIVAISTAAAIGEVVDSGVLYVGHASITVACILAIPTMSRRGPEIEDAPGGEESS